MTLQDFLSPALAAVWRASRCCELISEEFKLGDQQTKEDRSPVTVADYASQAIILSHLAQAAPDMGVVAEEGADALRDSPDLIKRIATFTSPIEPDVNADTLCDWIDRGNHEGGSGRFWTLDPIDGTKGFLRGGQYAVALSLVEDGQPVLGLLGCPRYAWDEEARGVVFSGGSGLPAQVWTSEDALPRRISVCSEAEPAEARLCESVESAHTAHDRSARLLHTLGMSEDIVRMDSQAKYAAVAHGAAALYLRLPVKKGYQEKIWDHAAGVAVIEAAGGRVTDLAGRPLDFSQGQTLAQNRGVIASNGALHHAALAAVAAESN